MCADSSTKAIKPTNTATAIAIATAAAAATATPTVTAMDHIVHIAV